MLIVLVMSVGDMGGSNKNYSHINNGVQSLVAGEGL